MLKMRKKYAKEIWQRIDDWEVAKDKWKKITLFKMKEEKKLNNNCFF